MSEAPVPAPSEEMQKAIVKLAEQYKALAEQNAALEAKITALSAPATAGTPAAAPEQKENPQDAAYRRVLAELGIKEDLQ